MKRTTPTVGAALLAALAESRHRRAARELSRLGYAVLQDGGLTRPANVKLITDGPAHRLFQS